jgi:hypothetical protein
MYLYLMIIGFRLMIMMIIIIIIRVIIINVTNLLPYIYTFI